MAAHTLAELQDKRKALVDLVGAATIELRFGERMERFDGHDAKVKALRFIDAEIAATIAAESTAVPRVRRVRIYQDSDF